MVVQITKRGVVASNRYYAPRGVHDHEVHKKREENDI